MPRRLPELQIRLRFPGSPPDAFGPGKADLLGWIASTGSIREAAAPTTQILQHNEKALTTRVQLNF
ncbi:MAG TPA: hypothetical protein VMI53_06100 [Opitutaceae bacterium]|nr:hypothetical protein [Opitutaceae bacterium]